ncbi:MAG: hypothetical protein LUG24_03265 [Clostridiales bacterium]|nr:hypothetical protein [Clostridiales bacterium]
MFKASSIVDLPVKEIKMWDITDFMVSGRYIYYIHPETGELWKVDFDGTVNVYVTDATVLSSKDENFGVYMLNDKSYYNSAAFNKNGEFAGNYNLYKADPDFNKIELADKNVNDFKTVGDLLLYNYMIHDESGNVITTGNDINYIEIFGGDKNCIYFEKSIDSVSDDVLREYNICNYNRDTGEVSDITDIFYNGVNENCSAQ